MRAADIQKSLCKVTKSQKSFFQKQTKN